MKKLLFIAICIVGMLSFSSCGSTSPCGLASNTENTKQTKENHPLETIVADASITVL